MKRYAILTVGKTHSGKTTFARELEQNLSNSLVIDQDNHAAFINKHYRKLMPTSGSNTLKYTLTHTIVDYAVHETNLHMIICNSNRSRKGREELLSYFRNKGFHTIIVNFDIPDAVLEERVKRTTRGTEIFRSASTFEEVLARQQSDSNKSDTAVPIEDEAEHLFIIQHEKDVQVIIREILELVR